MEVLNDSKNLYFNVKCATYLVDYKKLIIEFEDGTKLKGIVSKQELAEMIDNGLKVNKINKMSRKSALKFLASQALILSLFAVSLQPVIATNMLVKRGVPLNLAIKTEIFNQSYMDARAKEVYYETLNRLHQSFPNVAFNFKNADFFVVKESDNIILKNEVGKPIGQYLQNLEAFVVLEDVLNVKKAEDAVAHETIHHALNNKIYEKKDFEEGLTSFLNSYLYDVIPTYASSKYIAALSIFIPLEKIIVTYKESGNEGIKKLLLEYGSGQFDIVDIIDSKDYTDILNIKLTIIEMFSKYLDNHPQGTSEYEYVNRILLLDRFVTSLKINESLLPKQKIILYEAVNRLNKNHLENYWLIKPYQH